MAVDPINAVKRELLVRHLDTWLPWALRRSRRVTVVQAFAGPDRGVADKALRAVVEFADLLEGRGLAELALAAGQPVAELARTGTAFDPTDLATRLGAVQAELPPEVSVHVLPGGPDRIPVAVKAATAAAALLFGYLDVPVGPAPDEDVLRALASGRPAEVLLVFGPAAHTGPDQRAASRRRPGYGDRTAAVHGDADGLPCGGHRAGADRDAHRRTGRADLDHRPARRRCRHQPGCVQFRPGVGRRAARSGIGSRVRRLISGVDSVAPGDMRPSD